MCSSCDSSANAFHKGVKYYIALTFFVQLLELFLVFQDNLQVTKRNITLAKRIGQLAQGCPAHVHDLTGLFI